MRFRPDIDLLENSYQPLVETLGHFDPKPDANDSTISLELEQISLVQVS